MYNAFVIMGQCILFWYPQMPDNLGRKLLPLPFSVTTAQIGLGSEHVVLGHVHGVAWSRYGASQRLAQGPGVVAVIAAAQPHELDTQLLAGLAEVYDIGAAAHGGVQVLLKQADTYI